VDAGVVGEFGMESGGHHSSLPNRYRIFAFGGEDFHAGADALNLWRTDEDHFERRASQLSLNEFALTDGAVELASVGVATDADVDRAEAGLFGIFDFRRQQDCARAGTKGWFHSDELFEFFEAFFSQQLQKCARFTSGDHEALDFVELFGFLYEHNLSPQLFEPAAVGIEISLQREDTNLHDELILLDRGLLG